MNVLFIASDNNYTSGAFLSMVKLNEILNRDFAVNTFVVLPNDGDGIELLVAANISYEVVPSRNWIVDIEDGKTGQREREKQIELAQNVDAVTRIVELIKEKEIDLVHINTSYSYVGAEAAKRCNIPFIWHIREFLEEDQNRKIWDKEQGYALMESADAIVAISNSIYEKYKDIFPENKLHVIYNGIDEKTFYNPTKKIFQNEIVSLGITGGVVPHKGQEELIRACGMLLEKGIDNFVLHIYGKGKDTYREYLNQIVVEKHLENHVIFEGPSNNIPKVLEDIDVLCVCSRNEAFGRTTVEGMMAGCVLIGADTSGTMELLESGRSGYLYKQGSTKSLAETIEYVLKNKNKAESVRLAGQRKAVERYTAYKNAKEILELYQRIKGGKDEC